MDAGRVADDVAPHLRILRLPGLELDGKDLAGFVYGSFCRSLRRPGKRLRVAIRKPGVQVLFAMPVDSDVALGWLAANPSENRIVCAFTKAAYRASPEQRAGREDNADAFRIASSLALAAGIDFGWPVKCSFWSRAARAIAEKPGNPYSLELGR